MMNQEKIGKFIATLRKEKKKMTQEQFAEKLGVSNRSVSRWENGKTMPDLAMLPVISEELGVSISELLAGEQLERTAAANDSIRRIIELSEQEKQCRAKMTNTYFFIGMVCVVLVIVHGQYGIFNFAKEPELLTRFLIGFAIVFEIAGFYFNSKHRKYTEREIDVLLSNEKAAMKTAGEMLQYAKKRQKADLKQYEKAFQAIEEKLQSEETVRFSMVADTFVLNEQWSDSWKPWHAALAVSDSRIMICGEAIHGRFMTFYDVESFPLEGISSIELVNRKIVIKLSKDVLTIEGKEMEAVIGTFREILNK